MDAKGCRCNVWSNVFWNNFFNPRYPGVFLILIFVLLDIIYTCAFILISTYYENYSEVQHYGNFTTVCATILVMVTGFLSIHFLTLKPSHVELSYSVFLHVALGLACLLGIISYFLLSCSPDPPEILLHTVRFIKTYHKAPYFIRSTFAEKECCGIQSFGDVFPKFETTIHKNGSAPEVVTLLRIPASCCQQSKFVECEKWTDILVTQMDFDVNGSMYLNTRPCINPGESYDSLKTTETYKTYVNIIWSSFAVYIFIVGIFAVLNYHIWIVFPRVPMNIRPVKFNEDLRNLMTFQWCRKGQEAMRKKRSTWRGRHQAASEFKKRHELVQGTLSNYRTTSREQRGKDQLEKQLLAVKSSNALTASPSSRSFQP